MKKLFALLASAGFIGLIATLAVGSSSAASLPTGNLLANPGFETWTSGKPANWTIYNSTTTLTQATTVHSGKYSVKIGTTAKTQTPSGINDGATPTVSSTIAGVTYTAACWTKASALITVKIQLHETGQTGTSVAAAAVTPLSVATTTNWYQLSVKYTAAASGNRLPLSIYSTATVSGGATFQVDDCTLTEADTTAPVAPAGLTATATSPSQVNLAWKAATDNVGVNGYSISRNSTAIGTTTTTKFSDATATAGTTYTYTVVATDAAGNKSPPATVTSTLKPSAPTLAIPSPTRTPALSWNTVNGATSYNIYRDGTKLATGTTSPYTDTTAAEGSHTYDVTGANSAGEGPASNSVSVLVDRTVPTITSTHLPMLNPSGWNNTPVTVNFNCADNTGGSGIASCSGSTTVVTDGAGQTVTGTATDEAGNTASTTSAVINLDQTPPALSTPSWSAGSITIGSTTTLSVPTSDALSGAVGGEYYLGSTDPGSGRGTPMTYSGGNLSATLGSSLTPGTNTVNVRAEDAAGNWSSVTPAKLIVTDQPASAPANLVAYTTSPTQINLMWAAATAGDSPITGYEVYRNGSYLTTVTGLSFDDTAVSPGSTDTYTVAATDRYGVMGPASNSAGDTTPPNTSTPYSTSDMATALAAVVHSDNTQSAELPDGDTLWAFGDTTQINGQSTVSGFGYPHDSLVIQKAGTLNFTALAGPYGYGWQQVPNWSDGTFFWMGTPIVDTDPITGAPTLYILGTRIQAGASGSFSIVDQYDAQFAIGTNPTTGVDTLTYEGVTLVPDGASHGIVWGGATQITAADGVTREWLITGSHGVPCSFATDCKVPDAAIVPAGLGQLTNSAAWQVDDATTSIPNIPATANVGTTLGITQTSTGWAMFTKRGDAYGGSYLEELTAPSLTSPWTATNTWLLTPPSGAVTYGIAVHPEQTTPAGQVLVSYNVNGTSSSGIVYPYAQFLSLQP